MPTFTVYFRTDQQWGTREIKAKTAARALERARRIAEKNPDSILLTDYDSSVPAINEIEVCDEEDSQLAVWQDDDLRLCLAALDLLEAAEKVVARWERGDLAGAVRDLDAAIAKAREGAG
jgi:hypothetical protein